MLKKDLAGLLVNYITGRIAEAIRKRLQKLHWMYPKHTQPAASSSLFNTTAMVGGTENSTEDARTNPITPDPTVGAEESLAATLNEEEWWRRPLLGSALENLKGPRIGSGGLREIANGMLDGRVSREQAVERMDSLL